MEATVYPSIHDNYQYFPVQPDSPRSATLRYRSTSCQSNGTNQYGSWIFFRFLCRVLHYTTAPDRRRSRTVRSCRRFWDAAAGHRRARSHGGTYSTKAIEDTPDGRGRGPSSICLRQFGVSQRSSGLVLQGRRRCIRARGGQLRRSTQSNDLDPRVRPDELMEPMYPHVERLREAASRGLSRTHIPRSTIDIDFPATPFSSARDGARPTTTLGALTISGDHARWERRRIDFRRRIRPSTQTSVNEWRSSCVMTDAGTRFPSCNEAARTLSCKRNPLDECPPQQQPTIHEGLSSSTSQDSRPGRRGRRCPRSRRRCSRSSSRGRGCTSRSGSGRRSSRRRRGSMDRRSLRP